MRVVVLLSCAAVLGFGGNAVSAPSVEVLLRCSVKDTTSGQTYIPEKNFPALSRLLTDDVLAKYDKGCKGRLSAEERKHYDDDRNEAAAGSLKDLQQIKRINKDQATAAGIATEVVRSELDIPTKKKKYNIIVRDAHTISSLEELITARNRADGATFSYKRDFQNDNALTSLTGAVFGWQEFTVKPEDRRAALGIDHVRFAPGIEFDQERNRADHSKDVDFLAGRLLGEFHQPGSVFDNLYRYSGYLKTDSRGFSKIWGGYAEWQPVSNDLGISAGRALYMNSPMYYSISPVLHAEVESVASAGDLTNVAEGDRYFRAGPIIEANFWFVRGPEFLKSITFSAQYRQLWGSANSGLQKNLNYWQSHLAYNLDPEGHAAINMIYRQGDLPGTGQQVRDFKTGLTVKY